MFLSERHYCYQCGRSYKRKIHLNSHLRYECGKEAKFKCSYCPKSFHQKSNYKAHVKRHILHAQGVSADPNIPFIR